ncbi:hypothetical protein HDU79_004641 [Rhizoclosmatium sp. JEL0117]|nr:hypothetical protein HDU79_004641 [Rhizoclosmatium sp. JEL0117]
MSRNPLSKLASSNEAETEAQPKLPRKAIPHIRIYGSTVLQFHTGAFESPCKLNIAIHPNATGRDVSKNPANSDTTVIAEPQTMFGDALYTAHPTVISVIHAQTRFALNMDSRLNMLETLVQNRLASPGPSKRERELESEVRELRRKLSEVQSHLQLSTSAPSATGNDTTFRPTPICDTQQLISVSTPPALSDVANQFIQETALPIVTGFPGYEVKVNPFFKDGQQNPKLTKFLVLRLPEISKLNCSDVWRLWSGADVNPNLSSLESLYKAAWRNGSRASDGLILKKDYETGADELINKNYEGWWKKFKKLVEFIDTIRNQNPGGTVEDWCSTAETEIISRGTHTIPNSNEKKAFGSRWITDEGECRKKLKDMGEKAKRALEARVETNL